MPVPWALPAPEGTGVQCHKDTFSPGAPALRSLAAGRQFWLPTLGQSICRRQCQPVSPCSTRPEEAGGSGAWGLRTQDPTRNSLLGASYRGKPSTGSNPPQGGSEPGPVPRAAQSWLAAPPRTIPGSDLAFALPCVALSTRTVPAQRTPPTPRDVCRAVPSFRELRSADPEAHCYVTLGEQLSLSEPHTVIQAPKRNRCLGSRKGLAQSLPRDSQASGSVCLPLQNLTCRGWGRALTACVLILWLVLSSAPRAPW